MYDSICERRYLMYTEDVSETNQGGIGHIPITNHPTAEHSPRWLTSRPPAKNQILNVTNMK